ncbi:MAG TPA: 50S ribosomal protein L20 [candidate division Zixibacteria bacterium]|jgi:large subunit ribosomal protein L20
MPRATNNPAGRHRRKKYLKAARGNFGGRRKLIRVARETVEKGWTYAYRDRRVRKRTMRRLWTVRINAALRVIGLNYSGFINALKKSEVTLDRKVLAHMAATDPAGFEMLARSVSRET